MCVLSAIAGAVVGCGAMHCMKPTLAVPSLHKSDLHLIKWVLHVHIKEAWSALGSWHILSLNSILALTGANVQDERWNL